MHTEYLLDLEAKEVSSPHSRMGHGALEIDILPVCRILHASIGMAFVLSIHVSKHITLYSRYIPSNIFLRTRNEFMLQSDFINWFLPAPTEHCLNLAVNIKSLT